MRVAFIGHRTVKDAAQMKKKLTDTISKLIEDGADTFLFGSKSEFNSLCWNVVTELQTQYPNIKRICYTTPHELAITSKEDRDQMEHLYSIVVGGERHFKDYEGAVESQKSQNATTDTYIMRNQEMIDNSDICVFYYDKDYLPPRRKQSKRSVWGYQPQSGTAIAFTYARRRKKTIINMFE